MPLRQWMLRITAYADRLLDDLDASTGPSIKDHAARTGSAAARAPRCASTSTVARGASRLHHPPRHALRRHLHGARARAPAGRRSSPPRRAGRAVEAYVENGRRKSDLDRTDRPRRRPASSPALTPSTRSTARRSRSGSPTTSSWATAPAPSWPCPAHDERDFEFAKGSASRSSRWSARRGSRPRPAVGRPWSSTASPSNSGPYDGLPTAEAKQRITGRPREGRQGPEAHQLQAPRLASSAASATGASPSRSTSPSTPTETRARALRTPSTSTSPSPSTTRTCRCACPSSRTTSPARTGGRPGPRARLALLPEGGPLVRPRDQHHAAVGGLVLVLPALHRPEERVRAVERGGGQELDAGRPLRRRRRARRPAPALRPLLAQGPLRPGRGARQSRSRSS